MHRPTEAQIDQVVAETGMGRLQAYRHLQQRHALREELARGNARRHRPGQCWAI